MKDKPITYTPKNEPYLGLEALNVLDKTIIKTLQINDKCLQKVNSTNTNAINSLQRAGVIIIPQGISIALSIRELIRQGYILGAAVLVRPLAERALNILYLQKKPEKIEIWNRGWKYNERPSFSKMIEEISNNEYKGHEVTKLMNSIIHGDPVTAYYNLTEMGNGEKGFSVARITDNPDLCNEISRDTSGFLSVILSLMTAIYLTENQ